MGLNTFMLSSKEENILRERKIVCSRRSRRTPRFLPGPGAWIHLHGLLYPIMECLASPSKQRVVSEIKTWPPHENISVFQAARTPRSVSW